MMLSTQNTPDSQSEVAAIPTYLKHFETCLKTRHFGIFLIRALIFIPFYELLTAIRVKKRLTF